MNIYQKEELEERIEQITEQLGYLLMDMILMSFKKINTENQLLKESLETRLHFKREEGF